MSEDVSTGSNTPQGEGTIDEVTSLIMDEGVTMGTSPKANGSRGRVAEDDDGPEEEEEDSKFTDTKLFGAGHIDKGDSNEEGEEDSAETQSAIREGEPDTGRRGEVGETQAGIPAPAPTNLKPLNEIRSIEEANGLLQLAGQQKQQLQQAVNQLTNLANNNQISQQDYQAAMANAQSMNNSLDAYGLQIHQGNQREQARLQQADADQHEAMSDLVPEWADTGKREAIRTRVHNYLADNLKPATVKALEKDMSPEALQFLMKAQSDAATVAKGRTQSKIERKARQMRNAEREQEASEDREDYGDLESQIDAVAKLLGG